MQIFDTLIKTEYKTAVALGFFDGVHLGHCDVINRCVCSAKEHGHKSAVFTFSTSPSGSPLLTTNEQKFELFEKLQVDYVFCVDFAQFRQMSANDFVRDVLHDALCATDVFAGFNYHFGTGGHADIEDLAALCEALNIHTHRCEPVMYGNEAISSTRIRSCIQSGDIESANAMLGYNFSISSHILSGNHIGTKLDSPTINQSLDHSSVQPRFGVYLTKVTIGDISYSGATNIGTHPTVGKTTPLCETHLLDYTGADVYGKYATTQLLCFIREEKKFDDIESLKAQINDDITQIRLLLSK